MREGAGELMVDSYRIIEACKDARHPGDVTYLVVEFLSGVNVVCVEDFQMPALRETTSVPVTDKGDYVLKDGSKLTQAEIQAAHDAFIEQVQGVTDPAEAEQIRAATLGPIDAKWLTVQRQIIAVDIVKDVRDNITRHIATINAKGLTGDRRDRTIRPEHKVASGISQRPEIQAVRGVVTPILTPVAGPPGPPERKEPKL